MLYIILYTYICYQLFQFKGKPSNFSSSLASYDELLGKSNLIFSCTSPTNSNFWHIKIIRILICIYINILLFTT